MKIAMIGNPNVGKTALLNALTGGNFEVGNFPGTTVEKKEGKAKLDGKEIMFVDLPGIYSLEAYSLDEKVARDFLIEERPDLILNVVNASNLERNLYLTLQLSKFGIPMILVLNMVDEAERRGIRIDSRKLEEMLGIPVVETVAVKGYGIDRLKEEILKGGKIPKLKFEDPVKMAEEIAREVVKIDKKGRDITEVLDEVFMDKHLGMPIFFALMWMTFTFTFTVASPLSDAIHLVFTRAAVELSSFDGKIFELLGNGVVKGVGSVLMFLPNIAFLFLALSLLELSGYMPRAVYLMDGVMSSFGLTGRSVIPLIMGFGCNVPAVMATRTIEDDRVRLATLLVNPFISCSARLPIYVLFAGIFFPKNRTLVIMAMYIFSVLVALSSALLFRKTLLRGEAEYIIELPPYRIPNLRDVWILTWNRTKHFLQKAGTVILGMSIVIWFLTNFPTSNMAESYAGMLGKIIQPLFAPLGWNWQFVLAIIMGAVAKEVVVETLSILNTPIRALMGVPQALGFMVFSLLYMPCVATLATMKAEAGWKWTIFAVFYSFLVAYSLAFLVEVVARLI